MILKTAGGRAQVGRHGWRWHGGRTQQATARKDEQRGQRHPGRLNRLCSVLTQEVKRLKGEKVGVHKMRPAVCSGQLPFLG